jgi:ABC-type nitrate/sulfonate/bicarbonate transport system permease component
LLRTSGNSVSNKNKTDQNFHPHLFEDNMRQHYKTESIASRAEAALGFILALVIGVSIAALLVAWWSA